jgi:hypothetical protein
LTPLDTLTLEASRCELLAALEREAYPSLKTLEVEAGKFCPLTDDERERRAESRKILNALDGGGRGIKRPGSWGRTRPRFNFVGNTTEP